MVAHARSERVLDSAVERAWQAAETAAGGSSKLGGVAIDQRCVAEQIALAG